MHRPRARTTTALARGGRSVPAVAVTAVARGARAAAARVVLVAARVVPRLPPRRVTNPPNRERVAPPDDPLRLHAFPLRLVDDGHRVLDGFDHLLDVEGLFQEPVEALGRHPLGLL